MEILSENELVEVYCSSDAKIDIIDFTEFLIKNKANINKLLVKAVLLEKLHLVKFLLETKADVTYENNEPLISCFKYFKYNLDIIDLLVTSKADITARDNLPLLIATSGNRLDTVKYLIENKADVKSKNSLCLANVSYSGSVEVMELLIKNGADIFSRRSECIRKAVLQNNYEIMYYFECKGIFRYKPLKMNKKYLTYKTFRRWRKIVFKSFFRRVVTPLYYSPGFPGYLEGKKELNLNFS